MSPKKDFAGAMNRLTSREVVLSGDKNKAAVGQPFGESLREQLEKEASGSPIREVSITQLQDNPFQHLARPSYDEQAMQELVSSIRQNGFYGALLARRKRGLQEQYELAFGHRRKEAARQAGISVLPVKIIDLTDAQMARIMASENFAREDLAPLGEANIIGHLNIEQNLSTADISKIVGKGEGWIKLRLALYNAPPEIKEMVRQKPETLGHIRLLLQAKEGIQRNSLIKEVLKGSITREELQRRLKNDLSLLPVDDSQDISVVRNPFDTNFTSSIQETDGEKRNKQVAENRQAKNDTQSVASSPDAPYRKLYKKNLAKLNQALDELEKVRGVVEPTKNEKTQLQAIAQRLAILTAE